MVRRVAVAAVAIPVALGLVRVGGWLLVAALAALAVLGTLELFRMAAARGGHPFPLLGAGVAGLMPVAVHTALGGDLTPRMVAFAGVAWVIVVMTAAVLRRAPEARPLEAVTTTLVAPVYTGLMPSFVLLYRHGTTAEPWAATWLVFLPLVSVWICDSAAMTVGGIVGGPKFAPVVSPNKTWSGTIAGSLAGAVVAPLFGALLLAPHGVAIGIGRLALFGLVVASVGQVGDLAESLFKREAGVKDSGSVFPGHGGVLDRLDSLYWALPTGAALLALYGVL
ncbi:MAG: phosphatidate cytidylyltransferase [Gemmatimonadota bacterium]|nr:phosphatidate cytidylyltransferase [Gemmatimonadota bacterium]MDH5196793.1 phosphatidate cytidylyltransferase [Gemmatimonadota bacterium]